MPTKYPHTHCTVPRCAKPRARFSSHCRHHAFNLNSYGHPMATHTRERVYQVHRNRVTAGLLRYAHAPPMLAAVEIANQLLDYKPQTNLTYEVQVAAWARRAREAGVSAMDLLRVVAEFQAVLDSDPQRFPDARAERHAIARRVLRLGPSWGTWRPRARLLNNFGAMIRESLATWAWAFLKKLNADDEAKRELRRRAADFKSYYPSEATK